MIAAWMLFAVVLGGLLGAAALAMQPLLAAARRPRRAAWVGAMLLAIVWPAVGVVTGRTITPARLAPVLVSPFGLPFARAGTYVADAFSAQLAARLDALLLFAWAAATPLLLLRLGAARRRLERARGEWAAASLDGVPVRVSHDVGPAVVGLRSMEIVVPRWTLALDEPLRTLMLRHEDEHRAARDPQLLYVAAVAVALLPWNAALWWHARRLRLAVEMDCDARVLRAHPSRDRYGMLLLAIAQRRSAAPLLAPALSEPVSDLERRIVAMSTKTARSRLAIACACAAVALGIACSLQAPTDSRHPAPATASPSGADQPFREFRLTKQATPLATNRGPRYPDALREAKVEGEVLLQFVVEPTGQVDMRSVKVLRSTDPQFTTATLTMLADWRFSPAEVDGRPVRQLLEMPFQFSLGPPPGVGAGPPPRSPAPPSAP